MWGPSQCDFVVYSVSGGILEDSRVFVLRVVGVIELPEKPPGAKKRRKTEKRKIKEKESDFSQQAQFKHGNLMP